MNASRGSVAFAAIALAGLLFAAIIYATERSWSSVVTAIIASFALALAMETRLKDRRHLVVELLPGSGADSWTLRLQNDGSQPVEVEHVRFVDGGGRVTSDLDEFFQVGAWDTSPAFEERPYLAPGGPAWEAGMTFVPALRSQYRNGQRSPWMVEVQDTMGLHHRGDISVDVRQVMEDLFVTPQFWIGDAREVRVGDRQESRVRIRRRSALDRLRGRWPEERR